MPPQEAIPTEVQHTSQPLLASAPTRIMTNQLNVGGDSNISIDNELV